MALPCNVIWKKWSGWTICAQTADSVIVTKVGRLESSKLLFRGLGGHMIEKAESDVLHHHISGRHHIMEEAR